MGKRPRGKLGVEKTFDRACSQLDELTTVLSQYTLQLYTNKQGVLFSLSNKTYMNEKTN